LIAAARSAGIGALVIDPFVKSHRLDENSNMHMDAAATAWAEVADATGDAARAAFLLGVMTAEEAQNLAVPERERWRHVRLDDAKANLAPRAETARWFRLES